MRIWVPLRQRSWMLRILLTGVVLLGGVLGGLPLLARLGGATGATLPTYILDMDPRERPSRIVALDPTTYAVRQTFAAGSSPAGVVSPDGRYLYLAHKLSAFTAFDTLTGQPAWELQLPMPRQGYALAPTQRGVWLSRDGRLAYVLLRMLPTQFIVIDLAAKATITEFTIEQPCDVTSTTLWL